MSRTRHARASRQEVVLFVRVPKECNQALRKRLADDRKRRPWEYQSLANLVRSLLMQALDLREATAKEVDLDALRAPEEPSESGPVLRTRRADEEEARRPGVPRGRVAP